VVTRSQNLLILANLIVVNSEMIEGFFRLRVQLGS